MRRDAEGDLPTATDFIGRVALAGSYFYIAVGEQGTDKDASWENYGPTRVVGAGEPIRSSDELLYAGSFASPPIGNYVLNAWAWDRGSRGLDSQSDPQRRRLGLLGWPGRLPPR